MFSGDGSTKHLRRVGMVARWQPVHLGHTPVLRALCDCADQALIGVGSSNRHDLRTPFFFEETCDMIRLALAGYENYTLLAVPDLDNGPRWREMVLGLFGPLDLFVTDNPYVANLMTGVVQVMRPVELVSEKDKIALDGSMVRREMARGSDWKRLVQPEIVEYLVEHQLDERFRREFGLKTLALETVY